MDGYKDQPTEIVVSFALSLVKTWESIFFDQFQKANLIPGGNDSLVYTTLSGTVGMLVPFTSHEDHDFFQVWY